MLHFPPNYFFPQRRLTNKRIWSLTVPTDMPPRWGFGNRTDRAAIDMPPRWGLEIVATDMPPRWGLGISNSRFFIPEALTKTWRNLKRDSFVLDNYSLNYTDVAPLGLWDRDDHVPTDMPSRWGLGNRTDRVAIDMPPRWGLGIEIIALL